MSADDEKTRVLQRRAAKPAAPEVVGDKVAFPCPNGHRVLAPLAYGGKQGKCSKCGVDITIPRVGGASQAQPVGPPPAPVSPVPPAAVVPDLVLQPPPPPGGEIDLPALEPSASAPEPVVVGDAPPAGDEAPPAETWNFIGGEAARPAAAGFEPEAWSPGEAAGGFSGDPSNQTAMLVGRLWAERQHGGVIELHLAGGSVILPEWYDANWSRGTHGLFASQGADGTVTLTAVAWETVQKIVVRQLTEVPDDMFT